MDIGFRNIMQGPFKRKDSKVIARQPASMEVILQ